jgi:peptidoglycan LD-endopeptidase LytH
MHPQPGLSIERASALAIFVLVLIGAAYVVAKDELGKARHGKAEPALAPSSGAESPAPEPAAPAVAPPEPELAFPLPGFEHALRDNFDEPRGNRRHQALDIMAPRGTPVLAVDDGRIAKLYRGPLAGIAVYQFDEATTRVYFYAHLDRRAPDLAEGQPVKRGQVIGYVGSTGNAPESAPHLHFSVHQLGDDKRWWRGKAINPYPLLRK